MELLYLLMFLTGWFVCWIQMSKSDSRKVQQLQSEYRSLQSEYQEMERKWLAVSKRYANLHGELLESKHQLGQLEYQKSLVMGELWRLKNPVAPAQFESQQWKSPYPESAPLSAVAEANLDSNATVNP
jgi:septation ring formation regulator EzrA